MKRKLVLAVSFALVVFAMTATAQDKKPAATKAADFSGTWNLDLAKSKLPENNRIESQTLTVVQTATDIKITTATKRAAPPAGAPAGGGGGGMGGGRPGGGMGGGDQTVSYSIGKESKADVQMGQSTVPVTYNSKLEGGKLNLSSSRTMNMQGTEVTISSKETWELSADGKTLTVNRESNSPRGTTSSTSVYTKAQ